MRAFDFERVTAPGEALQRTQRPASRVVAGGTLLVDLLRLDVERPELVIDVNGLPWRTVEDSSDELKVGALVSNTELAYHPQVIAHFPLLSEAILAGASPQIRNRATLGGNLMQRTRCPYFRDTGEPACNKRQPGSGCAALKGQSRLHAILGTSEHCIAVHPSDMCVALAALDAQVLLVGANGTRAVAFNDFHLVPGDHPETETVVKPGELITGVLLRKPKTARREAYVKVRERASFTFALASAAVSLELEGDVLRNARIAFGGVATKPWRSTEAESMLDGEHWSLQLAEHIAAKAVADARVTQENQFKRRLLQNTLVRALQRAVEAA